jgi:hypothetical protein
MPTFLTTPRMPRELARRVERAVSRRGRRAPAGSASALLERRGPSAPRAWALPAFAAAVVLALFSMLRAEQARALEQQRSVLLDTVTVQRMSFGTTHERFLATVARWIGEASSGAGDDVIAPELADPGALDAWLGRGAVYLHASLGAVSPAALGDAAAASVKDAFLLCFVEPPASPGERDVLRKVRGVHFGGPLVDEQTANVRRLHEALAGLAVLDPAWEVRARSAESDQELRSLSVELERAPFDAARAASEAELLLLVLDRDRGARVALVDLAGDRLLLRLDRAPDLAGFSSSAKTLYTAQVGGCALALDVRSAVGR